MLATTNNGPQQNMTTNDQQQTWDSLRKRIHSTMVSYGSETVPLSMMMTQFRSEWSKDLCDFAVKLGFTNERPEEAVLEMLQKMPEELECLVHYGQHGQPITSVRVVPKEETRDNLELIDGSNQHKKEQKMQREQRMLQQRQRSFYYPHPPSISFASTYSGAFNAFSDKSTNPNLIPLGPRRKSLNNGNDPRCSSTATVVNYYASTATPSAPAPLNAKGHYQHYQHPFSASASSNMVFIKKQQLPHPQQNHQIPNSDNISVQIFNVPNNKENNKENSVQEERMQFMRRMSSSQTMTNGYAKRMGWPIPASKTTTTTASMVKNKDNFVKVYPELNINNGTTKTVVVGAQEKGAAGQKYFNNIKSRTLKTTTTMGTTTAPMVKNKEEEDVVKFCPEPVRKVNTHNINNGMTKKEQDQGEGGQHEWTKGEAADEEGSVLILSNCWDTLPTYGGPKDIDDTSTMSRASTTATTTLDRGTRMSEQQWVHEYQQLLEDFARLRLDE